MRRFGVSLVLVLTAVLAWPETSYAQGYGVYEQSACTTGRGGTAAASPCGDGSAIYFNPAGIAGRAFSGSIGGTLIAPSATFVNDNTGLESDFLAKVYPVPNLYISGPIADRYAVGLGVFVPYGLTTEWDKDTFEGRFLGYRSTVRAIYIQPTVAAKFGKVKVGAGLDITSLHLKLQRKADLSQVVVPNPALPPGTTFGALGIPYGTDFADTEISGDAWGVGYNVGIIYEVNEKLTLGARYLSRQNITTDNADATFVQDPTGLVLTGGNPFGLPAGTPIDALVAGQFQPGGLLVDQKASSGLRLPDQLVVGVTVRPVTQLALHFDAQRTWWTVFDQVPIDFAESDALDQALELGAKNVWTWRFGGEYTLSGDSQTVLRGGLIFHKGALPDSSVTPLLPEGNRTDFTVGVGTRIARSFYIDAAYMYVNQADRRGRTVPLTIAETNGLYKDQHAHLFGVTLTYDF